MKNVNSNKSKDSIISPIEEKGLIKINLDKYQEQLSSFDIKEKKSKLHLYIYPEDVIQKGINADAGKSFRGKMRNKLENLCNAILSSYKSKDLERLEKSIDAFKKNYLENYALNDYSFDSFSRTDKNRFIIEASIAIVKETI